MEIIALIGPSRCGKTTTLNKVYSKLGVSNDKRRLGSSDPNDFSDIVPWKGKQIAFYTMGDISADLVTAIIDYNNLNCDLLICACNDRFVRPFIEFKKYNTCQIIKQKEPNKSMCEAANTAIAKEISEKLDKITEI